MARTVKRWIAMSCAVLASSLGFAGPAPETAPVESEAVVSVTAEPDVDQAAEDDFSLSRLAQLEQYYGNGSSHEASPLTAGWDKKQGFFIRDTDDNFLLRIGGRVQVRYVYKGRDERGNDEGADEVGSEDDSALELERARVSFRGHVLDPRLNYHLQMDGSTDGDGDVKMLDYYILWKQADHLHVGAGQHKPYFLRQEKTSSGKQQMVDRSLATEIFNIDRTLAVWAQGSLFSGMLFYALEVGNGFKSRNRSPDDVDQIPHFAAKVDLNLWGEHKYEESDIKGSSSFVVGASIASDQNNNSSGVDAQQFKAYTFGLDAALKVSGFSLSAEYMGRWLNFDPDDPGDRGDSGYSHGAYVQTGFFVIPNEVEIAARASAIWGDSGDNTGAGVEVGPGVNWFFSKSHKVKWSTDVLFFDISGDVPIATTDVLDPDSFDSSSVNLEAGEQGVMIRTQLQLQF